MARAVLFCLLLAALSAAPQAVADSLAADGAAETSEPARKPKKVDYGLYFFSEPHDASECAMAVEQGRLIVEAAITNPAMTCPDMTAWKLYLEVVKQEFWRRWPADPQVWPAEPLPLCAEGRSGPDCCTPDSLDNPGYDDAEDPARHCPYFPGRQLDAGRDLPLPRAQPPSKTQASHFDTGLARLSQTDFARLDPGLQIRQSMAELVFRNAPMFDYVFRNGFYHRDGTAAVFAAANRALEEAPYRRPAGEAGPAAIDFPIPSVMVKSNWILSSRAEALGVTESAEHPFVKMRIESGVIDNDVAIFEPGEYWLISLHVSSKDLPAWFWSTFEHVDNPGRCDLLGCNDSYGFASPDAVPQGAARNFTRPYTDSDGLPIESEVFLPGRRYPGGELSEGLAAAFDGLGIGTTASSDPTLPKPADEAWRSYRLKGSQTSFTDVTGRPTLVGNSVIEGGFVQTASCITCHSRAHVGPDGFPSVLGIFTNQLSILGYGQSANGVPDQGWFTASHQPPSILALQTDFVWGFLSANPLKKAD